MVRRGALIVFEGCDRAGKSTQAQRMVGRIQALGERAELISFPDRSTDLGKFIDQYLKGSVEMEPREAHLVFAANRQALVGTMRSKLQLGTHLIVDRYTYSGIAYTLAKGLDVDLEWAKMHDVGILKPDCVLYFDLLPDEARKRSGFGDERLEAYEYQCTVYKIMQTLGIENADIWKVIDASKSIDEVSTDVWNSLKPVLDSAAAKPIEYIELSPWSVTNALRSYVRSLTKWVPL
uniref:Thymidylate kinase n=1 Tax=Parascaris univalens TaxID=6257 RepID=A0A915A549_PARUN